MENASKALIIAGAILISILIVSLGILIFNNFAGKAKDAADMKEQEISAFNSKIKSYIGNSVAGSQVNALLQYCLSCNTSSKNKGYTDRYITVTYPGGTLTSSSTTYNRVDTSNAFYTVKGEYNNGFLTIIKITKN